MNILKQAWLLLLLTVCTACEMCMEIIPVGFFSSTPYREHTLCLNFQDALGIDLVEGIESDSDRVSIVTSIPIVNIKYDLYTLDVIFPDGFENPWEEGVDFSDPWAPDSKYNKPMMALISDYNLLLFNTKSYKEDGKIKAITFRLTCPHVFGDDAPRDIITWWKPYEHNKNIQICNSIEFYGRKITQIEYIENKKISVATIVLNGNGY